MRATFSVIILWDNYFIITPLYLFIVIDICAVCFHFIPTHLFLENPNPCQMLESKGEIVGDLGGQISGQKNSSFPLETAGAIGGSLP